MDLRRVTKLKEQVERLKREADRAEGALQAVLSRLKSEYDCDSLEEANNLLKKLEKRLDRTEEKFEAELKKFENKWSHLLR